MRTNHIFTPSGVHGRRGGHAIRVILRVHSRIVAIVRRARRLVTYWRYRGSRYQCPTCGRGCSGFLPLATLEGGKYVRAIEVDGVARSVEGYETLNVENYLCPFCGATDKARLYALFLRVALDELASRRRVRFVHFAPDVGIAAIVRQFANIEYRTADLYRTDVDDRVDLTNLDVYPDASVDCLLCSHVLEHISDDATAMRELHRVLAPGGFGIVMVPILLSIDTTYEDATKTTHAQRLRHFGLEDHVRVYAKQDFVARLERAGFQVELLGRDHFGNALFERSGITPQSVLYVVRKY